MLLRVCAGEEGEERNAESHSREEQRAPTREPSRRGAALQGSAFSPRLLLFPPACFECSRGSRSTLSECMIPFWLLVVGWCCEVEGLLECF